EWGTAVNVQAMVYGNTGDTSGSGVAFTRNPANGVNEFYGEFLINAQGEDVEFTIQDGKLFMLQTRNGKRTAAAALKFSIDMFKEKLIDWETAILRNP